MAVQAGSAAGDQVVIRLHNDRSDVETSIPVSPALAALCAYADAWAREESRRDDATLTFSSTLAAMVAGEHPLCGWLRLHLALRGSAAAVVTKGRAFPGLSVPTGRLTTTHSFRRALEQATRLARHRTLDVRHLMAAYPVVKDYHAGDFLASESIAAPGVLRSRSICSGRTPPRPLNGRIRAAGAGSAAAALPARFGPRALDLLGVGREVEAFSMLIAARTAMPLSIGVFGAWGFGRATSWHAWRSASRRWRRLAPAAGVPASHRTGPVQCLALQRRRCRGEPGRPDSSQSAFRAPREQRRPRARRADALAQVAAHDREWRALQSQADAAAAEESRLRDEWRRITAEHDATVQRTADQLTAAQASVAAAERLSTMRSRLRRVPSTARGARHPRRRRSSWSPTRF
jgi:hypothetical protein